MSINTMQAAFEIHKSQVWRSAYSAICSLGNEYAMPFFGLGTVRRYFSKKKGGSLKIKNCYINNCFNNMHGR